MAGRTAIGHIKDRTTGWEFDGATLLRELPTGYAITDLTHGKHPCAAELMVAAVLVVPHDRKKFEWFLLGMDRVKRIRDPEIVEIPQPSRRVTYGTAGVLPLGFYAPRLKVTTTFRVENLFGEANQDLTLELAFLFTSYNKDPSHEPGGIVKAARMYPLLKFRSPAIDRRSSFSDPANRIAAIRVIYLLNFSLSGKSSKNQVGIFRDRDLIGSGRGPGATVFAAAEKPLALEVVGRGLTGGTQFTQGVASADWDNIHQWNGEFSDIKDIVNAYKAGGQMLPTPGAPYAIHQHWRWGDMYYFEQIPGLEGGKRFGGLGGAGGPMVDPRVPNQDLSFAITDTYRGIDLFYQHLETSSLAFDDPLERFFTWDGGKPAFMFEGSSFLSTWVDILARSSHYDAQAPYETSLRNPFEGSLFAHGIFFAHDSEDVMPFFNVPGAYKPQYIPSMPDLQKPKWRRP